ncbi:23S ribosomal RNA methyltransferase Erm [Cohnella terricola]|uniref:rRNA adenine N-6-methyltransferase n=1 Tax=Cohnella terricola TaxID=1289167 RepID=A0A559J9X7_9BACL|nr:23S ribosomal RNA methyltransferase Erm [Cohnella terricola]TVX96652.1 23S ribosomal RNA methyltransferase Erm [Cohnella terricola]
MRGQNKKHRTIRKCKSGPNFTGQHLLHNPKTIKQLIETACLQSTDTVLEIGAGKGGLTFPIAEKAGRVIAVEIDADFVGALRAKSKGCPKIKIIQGDIREMRLPVEPFCVVANIPFSITTAIFEKLLGAEGKAFQKGALILEKGAARRFTEGSTLDPRLLMWRMNFQFEMRTVVPRTHFAPPPRVDAAIIQIVRRDHPLVPANDAKRFMAFAAYALSEPRQLAAEALKGIFTPAQLKTALKNARVDRERAVALLSQEQWASLFHTMRQHVAPYRWPKM